MLDWLPDFLDGLFNMLSDSNPEIRHAADTAIAGFLCDIKRTSSVDYGPMVGILVSQSHSKERFNRLTAITWVKDFIKLGGDRLVLFYSELLGSIMYCISDDDDEIREVAGRTNVELLGLVKDASTAFELSPLLQTLTSELFSHHIPTRMASLRWISMLLEKVSADMSQFISELLPALLRTLSDEADEVVLTNLEVLARISLLSELEFKRVLDAIVDVFATDRNLLELRGSLIIRNLCVLLNAKSIYISLAAVLGTGRQVEASLKPSSIIPSRKRAQTMSEELDFRSIMVQTLSLILLTARELDELRTLLRSSSEPDACEESKHVFVTLFRSWCHSPVSTLGLCLIAEDYDLASSLIVLFADVDVTVGFLMQVDKLVQLIESPVFIHLRLQLLEVHAPYHPHLVKSLYGLLMLLPQSPAFNTLSNRLATVSCMKNHLASTSTGCHSTNANLHDDLVQTFRSVQECHSRSNLNFVAGRDGIGVIP